MSGDVEIAIAGAGVIGLAIARHLAQAGHEVVVLEAEAAHGTASSARNSEVIHAGIYYPPQSLRARLCVDGSRALYAYCDAQGVAARAIGKLIVATSDHELRRLDALYRQASANGVRDIALLNPVEIRAMEPELQAVAALYSPTSGIVDSHGLMRELLAEAQAAGAILACHSPVRVVAADTVGFRLRIGGPNPSELICRRFINAAGHGAIPLARATEGLAPHLIPRQYFAKGHYFSLAGRSPFRHLIYPLPEPGGAGIHVTLDMSGAARFGPDVQNVDGLDYAVDPARAALFYPAIRRYWPGLRDGALTPAYAGIRPKIVPPQTEQDFVIQGPRTHHVPGLVNLFGMESPGLTACLAIAEEVLERLKD